MTRCSIYRIHLTEDDMVIEVQEDITNAIKFNEAFRANVEFIMNGTGKTLENTVRVETGHKGIIRGLTVIEDGSITNIEGDDVDGNSSIVIA